MYAWGALLASEGDAAASPVVTTAAAIACLRETAAALDAALAAQGSGGLRGDVAAASARIRALLRAADSPSAGQAAIVDAGAIADAVHAANARRDRKRAARRLRAASAPAASDSGDGAAAVRPDKGVRWAGQDDGRQAAPTSIEMTASDDLWHVTVDRLSTDRRGKEVSPGAWRAGAPAVQGADAFLDADAAVLAATVDVECPADGGRGAVVTVADAVLPSLLALLVCTVFLLPIILCGLSVIFGGLLAATEGWPLTDGFLYFGGSLAGLGNPLVGISPSSVVGRWLDIFFSFWILILYCGCTGAISQLKLIERLQNGMPLAGARGLGTIFVTVPLLLVVFCGAIGLLLATIERRFSLSEGFLYIVSAVCGLGTPLTNRTPDTLPGKIFVILCGCWSISICGSIIGIVSAAPLIIVEDGIMRRQRRGPARASFEPTAAAADPDASADAGGRRWP